MFHWNRICCSISLITVGFDLYWHPTQMCRLICEMRGLLGTIATVPSPMGYYMSLRGNEYNRSAALSSHTKSRTSSTGWNLETGCAETSQWYRKICLWLMVYFPNDGKILRKNVEVSNSVSFSKDRI